MPLATVLLGLAITGVLLVAVQHAALVRHLGRRRAPARELPPISILKPLCGIDDDLDANLERFAILDYPDYEVLLGIESTTDPAFRVARALEARWPDRVRVVMRRGSPGLNPKVNQLLTLAAVARHDVLVISDSNIRVDYDYLREIAAHLEDPDVALVTHPIAGVGERRIGSTFDSLHLASAITPGLVAAKVLFGKDVVVGKSMAFRRADLAALGGLERFQDVLAEDYAMGVAVRAIGRKVALAHRPVLNVTRTRALDHFWSRYRRWAVIQRTMVGRPTYALQAVLNPLPLAAAGFAAEPAPFTLAIAGALAGAKILLDAASTRALRGEAPDAQSLAWIPLKDAVAFGAFLAGFVVSRVDWRGKVLQVGRGTRLSPARAGFVRSLWARFRRV